MWFLHWAIIAQGAIVISGQPGHRQKAFSEMLAELVEGMLGNYDEVYLCASGITG
jgi:hypothetical protein